MVTMVKQGFNVDHYNLKPNEAGWAGQVNKAVEALADGLQLSDDLPALKEGGAALLVAIMKNASSKEAVLIILTKLIMANIFDELAEREQEMKKITAAFVGKDQQISQLKRRVVQLETSARK